MNKKKILILLILSVVVIGLSMSAVSAKSVTLKVKNGKYYEKKVGHGDLIFSHYHTKYYG